MKRFGGIVVVALLAGIALTGLAFAEETHSHAAPTHDETRASVPELTQFHDVIRRLWHDAWPGKDYVAMRAMLPEIRERSAAVMKADLPGILRDKQVAWDEGVKELEAVVEQYAAAVEGTDDQKLLDAGERLHAQFEQLVRTIRPPLAELEAFHVVLYKLYHYDMPAGDLDAIRASVGRLKEPMAALGKTAVPERFRDREKEFVAARKRLSVAVDRLAGTVRSKDLERITSAIEDMHGKYEALAQTCD